MMLRIWLVVLLMGAVFQTHAQLNAGPVIGHSTETSTIIWYQCLRYQRDSMYLQPKESAVKIWPDSIQRIAVANSVSIKAYFNHLSPGIAYDMYFPYIQRKKIPLFRPDFTKSNFSFLLGSCMLTLPLPGKSIYPGKRIEIFRSMARDTTNDFMLWMGDYVYYADVQLKVKSGMFHRMNHQRTMFPEINQFHGKLANYAMWDDHDYGPNNAGGDFYLKEKSKKVFKTLWPNPPIEDDSRSRGMYFTVPYRDIQLFMMDGRYHKFNKDSLHQMWGKTQLDWLKKNLAASKATFKFIVNGSQMLTKSRPRSPETLFHFRNEYDTLMRFIREQKIEGVVFLSGDIHSSEILRSENEGMYPLFEYTCSALTSPMYGGFHNAEVIPGYREFKENNYGKISIETHKGHRLCIFRNFDKWGNLHWEYAISAEELKFR
jgi:alkaline phosphatase D